MMAQRALRRLVGVSLVLVLIAAGVRPATTLGRAAGRLSAAAHGPSGNTVQLSRRPAPEGAWQGSRA